MYEQILAIVILSAAGWILGYYATNFIARFLLL